MSLEAQTAEHLAEQRKLRHHNKHVYQLMGGVTLVAIGLWLGAQLLGGDAGFTTNVYTEGLSILVTVLVLNWFADRRATRQRKQELFLQLGSQSNDFALEAKRQLEQLGWLEEALKQKKFPRAGWQGMVLNKANLSKAYLRAITISGADLTEANLCDANLMEANLAGSIVESANLHCANLEAANLSDCSLWNSNITNGNLMVTDLQRALLNNVVLRGASLRKSNLTGANLTGTDLTDAELIGANLDYILVNNHTILPDGTNWYSGTDWTRFTDPEHPDFWRSDDPHSPA